MNKTGLFIGLMAIVVIGFIITSSSSNRAGFLATGIDSPFAEQAVNLSDSAEIAVNVDDQVRAYDVVEDDSSNNEGTILDKIISAIIPTGSHRSRTKAKPVVVEDSPKLANTLTGKLEIIHTDDFVNKKAVHYYFLVLDNGERIELNAKEGQINEELNGSNVDIEVSAYSSKTRPSVKYSVNKLTPKTEGVTQVSSNKQITPPPGIQYKKIATILYNFQDNTATTGTVPNTRHMIYDNSPTEYDSVAGYYNEMSYGKIKIVGKNNPNGTGDIYGWYTIPFTSSFCDFNTAFNWNSAAASIAMSDGFDPNGYDAVVFMFPATNCGGWGGFMQYITINGINVPAATINSGWSGTIVHELGHAFNLGHSSSWSCVDAANNPVIFSAFCTGQEYGDPFDIMANTFRQMSVFQKESLGIFTSNQEQKVTTPGVYEIYSTEIPFGNPKKLDVYSSYNNINPVTLKSFSLEYRRPHGIWDNFSTGNPVVNGVSIRLSNFILDAHPQTATFDDAPLGITETFTDPMSDVSITTIALDSQKATVLVQIPNTCHYNLPILKSVIPYIATGNPNASFTVSVMNTDSLGCPNKIFQAPAVIDELGNIISMQNVTINPSQMGSFNVIAQPSSSATAYGTHAINFPVTHLPSTLVVYAMLIFDYQPAGCVRNPIAWNIVPNPISAQLEQITNYTINIINNDTPSCTARTHRFEVLNTGYNIHYFISPNPVYHILQSFTVSPQTTYSQVIGVKPHSSSFFGYSGTHMGNTYNSTLRLMQDYISPVTQYLQLQIDIPWVADQ